MVVEETSQEPVEPKRIAVKFRESSNFARLSFVIGVMTFFLTVILTGVGGLMLVYGKILTLAVISYLLAFDLVGLVLGYLSIREEKNVFGITGFFTNFAFFVFYIIGLVGILSFQY